MKTVGSGNMPFVREAFETLGEIVVREGRAISAEDVKDADVLAIRSTTNVDAELIGGSSVKFVGTATIGTDHLDIDYFEKNKIGWCFSPGCNANSVSEYVTAALLELAVRHDLTLRGLTMGVIGVGNVGRRVVEKARALGMTVLQNDPPRARQEGDAAFTPLEELLPQADVVSLHVPLTKEGADATYHLADASFFAQCKPGTIFLNAARGAVVDTPALLEAMANGPIARTVIDTWEGEPCFSSELLHKADLGTPHIAGHSYDGKVAGTVMVYQAACKHLGIEPAWTPDELLPPALVPEVHVAAATRRDEEVLHEIVRQLYDITQDDAALREGAALDDGGRAAHFDRLRKGYPVRREFQFTQVEVQNGSEGLRAAVRALGLQMRNAGSVTRNA